MAGYFVVKRIGGKAYKYRQRTYREGGKVRTQSQYVCALSDSDVTGTVFTNPFVIKETTVTGAFANNNAEVVFAQKNISPLALDAEYGRVGNYLERLGLDKLKLPKFEITGSTNAGWKRKKDSYEVRFDLCGKSSGRNKLKHHYRIALAHAFLDRIEEERSFLFDHIRSSLDQSYFNTKWIITQQLLVGNEKHKIGLTLLFLWSGSLPQSLEKQFAIANTDRSLFKRDTWRDEAAVMIAEVLKRGYKPSLRQMEKQKKKAASTVKRSWTQYRKLGFFGRLSSKGRKLRKRIKKHEASYLVAYHRHSRMKMLSPLMEGFHGK